MEDGNQGESAILNTGAQEVNNAALQKTQHHGFKTKYGEKYSYFKSCSEDFNQGWLR